MAIHILSRKDGSDPSRHYIGVQNMTIRVESSECEMRLLDRLIRAENGRERWTRRDRDDVRELLAQSGYFREAIITMVAKELFPDWGDADNDARESMRASAVEVLIERRVFNAPGETYRDPH